MASGRFNHLCDLGLRDFVGEHATHPNTVLMYVQHDSHGGFPRFVEKPLKDVGNELHRRIVVVEDQHAVHRRLLGLGLRLCDDGRTSSDDLSTLLLVSHDTSPAQERRPWGQLDME